MSIELSDDERLAILAALRHRWQHLVLGDPFYPHDEIFPPLGHAEIEQLIKKFDKSNSIMPGSTSMPMEIVDSLRIVIATCHFKGVKPVSFDWDANSNQCTVKLTWPDFCRVYSGKEATLVSDRAAPGTRRWEISDDKIVVIATESQGAFSTLRDVEAVVPELDQ